MAVLAEEIMMIPVASGYYRDSDDVCYVSKGGTAFLVQSPWNPEPVWRICEELSEDAERAKDQDSFGEFERTRVAYGIEA